MMRASKVVVASLALAVLACSVSTSSPTPTSVPTPTPLPSSTATATVTPTLIPTSTRTPTATFEPAPRLDGGTMETTLRADGYRRYPFVTSGTGEDAFFWDNGSGIMFYTYPDSFEIGFLNDPRDLSGRVELIDQAIEVVTPLFAPSFVAGLQDEAHAYAERVASPTGDPTILDYGQDPWLGELLEYNGYGTLLRDGPYELSVYLSLLHREYRCDMTQYSYCYFIDMPSMTFVGDASLTYMSIWIEYP
jgi:hypothetical protein